MYSTTHTAGAAVAGSTLAFTGVSVVWAVLAGALIGAGAALLRLIPRPEA